MCVCVCVDVISAWDELIMSLVLITLGSFSLMFYCSNFLYFNSIMPQLFLSLSLSLYCTV